MTIHTNGKTRSIWFDTQATLVRYPKLQGKVARVDVAVIGGGMTGITAALELQSAGKSVILLERDQLLSGETGRTTAHLTEMVDARYHQLIGHFGVEKARLVARSSREAIEHIEARVSELKIDCGFERVPGYFYSDDQEGIAQVKSEFKAARSVGVKCDLTGQVPLPFSVFSALKIENQAQFHPGRYLAALVQRFTELGGRVFESSPVRNIEGSEPCLLRSDEGELEATDVVVATDSPISSRVFIHTKVAAYRTYAMAFRLLSGQTPRGLFWDTKDPYHYTRNFRQGAEEWLIVGGDDHKVAMGDPEASFESLESYCRSKFDVGSISHRWSGEVLDPVDGLPYIGLNPASRHQYIATGFAGNGMTFGTIAGRIVADLLLGRKNPYSELYSARRFKPLASAANFVSENLDFPKCLIGDRIKLDKEHTVADVKPGDARVLSVVGKSVAVYRDEKSVAHCVSAVCTHLGCLVRFNASERSWDCPCHGSRFAVSGEVLHGPARAALEKVEIEEPAKSIDPAA